jgi:AmmeMemoRadiSam system protein A
MNADGAELLRIARWSVEAALHGDHVPAPCAGQGLLAEKRGVFVTVWKLPRELRGCVGALEPHCASLLEETWRVARLAAFGDERFKPVTSAELTSLLFKVSVLEPLRTVQSEAELDPQRFGVVVRTLDGRCGALLPFLEDVKTTTEQLGIARRKGGIGPMELVSIERFAVRTFEETPTGEIANR